MIITYEDLKENLASGAKQIAEFFGFSQSRADSVYCRQGKLPSNEKKIPGDLWLSWSDSLPGAVGDWKNLFTEAQSQEMDAKFKECLGGTKLKANLKYDVYCKA
ncbi:unnamed protein product [Natator depressus]